MRRSPPARFLKFVARSLDDAGHYSWRLLFPGGRRSLLFEVSNPFGFDAQAPVIRELISRGRLSVSIFSVRRPHADALIAGEYDRSRFLASLGLDPALKTVLIWSHWTSHSLFRSSELREFASFLSRQNINVIVSAHFHLFDQASTHFSGGVDWWHKLTDVFTGPRVKVLSRVADNRELLWAADVLVGDHSSLHVEYAVLRRPMVIYVNAETPLGDRHLQDLLEETVHVFRHHASADADCAGAGE